MTKFLWRSCECRSDRQLPLAKPTRSRGAAVRRRRSFCQRSRSHSLHLPSRISVGRSSLGCGSRSFVTYMSVRTGLTSWEVSCLLGIGTSTSLRLHVSTHSALSLNLLKRPESLEVGEGALSKLLAGTVFDYLGFSSVSSPAAGALAPFRKSHVSLPTSAVKAPSWRKSAET